MLHLRYTPPFRLTALDKGPELIAELATSQVSLDKLKFGTDRVTPGLALTRRSRPMTDQ